MPYQTRENILGGRAILVRSFDDSDNLIGENLIILPSPGQTGGGAQPSAPEADPGSAIIEQSTQEAAPTVPSAPPGTRVFEVVVKDGIRTAGGDLKLYSTGSVAPGKLEGWVAPANALESDNNYATTAGVDAVYSDELVASNFGFNLPENAIITGIQVTVERSKV